MTTDEIEKDRALERIWAEAPGVLDDMGFWQPNQSAGLEAYVRADLFDAMTAERDAALALVAAAYEVAAKFIDKRRDDYISEHGNYDYTTGAMEFPSNGDEWVSDQDEISEAIRALTPADALAAQTARDERMQKEGAKKAEARIARLEEALKWYGEQTRLARLVHSEGDVGRYALVTDGGKKACAVLQENSNEQLNLF